MANAAAGCNRLRDLKAFDDTKAGVKGLVDSGVTAVPPIFHHPPDPLPVVADNSVIPVIDLALAGADRAQLVAKVKAAGEGVGFFQVVNHGVPGALLDEMLAAVQRFNDEPLEAKRPYYTRDRKRRVNYNCNFDLFQSPAANWRDTIFLELAPTGPPPEQIPAALKGVLAEYVTAVQRLGRMLFELLSEALDLPAGYLGCDAGLADGLSVAAHYYPACPEPDRTLGTTRHSDPSFLTVLLQDSMGGLQALLDRGHGQCQWVYVPYVAGALVVNMGDFLQLVSNDRLKSVEHRVVASGHGSRVSVASFFRTNGAAASSREYGPIPELVAASGRTAVYRGATVEELVTYYKGKGLDGRSALDHFRLPLNLRQNSEQEPI